MLCHECLVGDSSNSICCLQFCFSQKKKNKRRFEGRFDHPPPWSFFLHHVPSFFCWFLFSLWKKNRPGRFTPRDGNQKGGFTHYPQWNSHIFFWKYAETQKGKDHLPTIYLFGANLLHPLVKDNIAMKFMDPPCEEMTFLLKIWIFQLAMLVYMESRDSGIPPPR